MEELVRQRIKKLISFEKNVTLTSLGGSDAAKMQLSRQINGSTSISLGTILLIIEKIPNVSTEWLLRGVGEMYLPGNDNDTHGTPTAHLRDTSETSTEYERELKNKDAIIESLQERIAEQKNYIADLRLIANLNMK